jgi:small redox-active disulfide protein 2
MKTIQILGTGCPKCEALAANAEQAVRELGIEANVVKVKEISEIMKFGVMLTPALAVDGKVIASGKALSAAEIKKHLQPPGVTAGGCCSSKDCCD